MMTPQLFSTNRPTLPCCGCSGQSPLGLHLSSIETAVFRGSAEVGAQDPRQPRTKGSQLEDSPEFLLALTTLAASIDNLHDAGVRPICTDTCPKRWASKRKFVYAS